MSPKLLSLGHIFDRHLEAEVTRWQVLVDKVRGDAPPDFDNQTLAVLRGRLVRYLMRSKEAKRNFKKTTFPHLLLKFYRK